MPKTIQKKVILNHSAYNKKYIFFFVFLKKYNFNFHFNFEFKTLVAMDLAQLNAKIEKMTKFNQIQILKIIANYDTSVINENRNGIYINLSEVHEDVLSKLVVYLNYLESQESTLDAVEKQKGELKNTYFKEDEKTNLK